MESPAPRPSPLTVQQAPFDDEVLLKDPPDDEEWQCYLVSVDDPNFPRLGQFRATHFMRKTPDDKFCLVGISVKGAQRLRDLGHVFEHPSETEIRYHGSEFSAADRLYGESRARQMYQKKFIRNATRGINSGRRKGLSRLYMRTVRDPCVQITIRWADLVTEILQFHGLFAQCCRILGLHGLGSLTSDSAQELIERDEDAWRRWFQVLYTVKTARPAEDKNIEKHKLELEVLSRLLEFACSTDDDFCAQVWSSDSLEILGDVLGLGFPKPLQALESGLLEDVLLQQERFPCTRAVWDRLQGPVCIVYN